MYYVKVTAYDVSGNLASESMPVFIYNGVDIAESQYDIQKSDVPKLFLSPNPVKSYLNIQLSLPDVEHVTLKIFDNTGRLNKELVNEKLAGGNYFLNFHPKCAGIYFIIAQIGNQNISEKIIVSK